MPANIVTRTITTMWYYPEHLPRSKDPNYKAFTATKRRLKKQGLWKCAVRDCANTDIELHHSKIEFALTNGVDLEEFNDEYGLSLTQAEFLKYVNGPEGTTPLCELHHRGVLGIHVLPEPAWRALQVWRDDLPPPAIVTFRKES